MYVIEAFAEFPIWLITSALLLIDNLSLNSLVRQGVLVVVDGIGVLADVLFTDVEYLMLIRCWCPRLPLSLSRSSLSLSRLRFYSAAHVIVRCVGVVFEGHAVSPDTIVDVVSSAMLIERTLSLPVDMDAVSDSRRI